MATRDAQGRCDTQALGRMTAGCRRAKNPDERNSSQRHDDADGKGQRIARCRSEQASEPRPDKDADSLQAGHDGNGAPGLVGFARVGDIGLPAEHPGGKPRAAQGRTQREQPRRLHQRDQPGPADNQRQPEQQHDPVAEAAGENAGRYVEREQTDPANADNQCGQGSAHAELDDIDRQQNQKRRLARRNDQRRQVDRQQEPIVG